ncbi:sugar transporter [Xylariomycetidae sp. FL0641]|nr:sugar transporter [Xylariomycetidae sp. FL0641]
MLGMEHLKLRESFNTRLTLAILLIAFSQFNFGFDQQGFNSAQAMDAFARQFGRYDAAAGAWALPTRWVSLYNGLNYIGFALGILLGSAVSRRYGRRMCMFAMSVWACVGATLVITSRTGAQMLAGRTLNYLYIGMELAVVPVFQAEVTPRRARGFVVGTYQLSLAFGGLVINCVARGTGDLPSNAAWQIPFGLFYVVPVIVAACVWFIPESPRWLVLKDRHEAALQSLRLLRQGKFTDDEIQAEFEFIREGIAQEHEKGTFLDMFRGKVSRRRTFIVFGVNFFLQTTGSLFVTVYAALFIKGLGTVNPFTITAVLGGSNVFHAAVSMVLVDRLGRRTMLFLGGSIQGSALLAMGALGTVSDPSHAVKSGIVALMVIFMAGYYLGWAPVSHILSPEIPSMKMRDVTYRTASFGNVCIQLAISMALPYLLNKPGANLGSKVGFIFGSVVVVSLVFTYFYIPECKGRTLEEIDLLFEAGVPTRKFKHANIEELPQVGKELDEPVDDVKRDTDVHVEAPSAARKSTEVP